MASRIGLAILLLPAIAAFAEAGYNLPLDRPYTLRAAEPSLLERELARQIRSGGPMSFIFPRPCSTEVDTSRVCGEDHGFGYRDSSQDRRLNISPMAGYEYGYLKENVHYFEMGFVSTGNSGPVSFYLDTRMFTELHEDAEHPSRDREFVERQNKGTSGAVAYSSYSRYRSTLSYDWGWGRLAAARDAAHWGPGLFTNLVFQQAAVPFNQLTFTTHLGPITVQSLYGQLAASRDWEFDTSAQNKSMYAHRYEWRVTRNLLLGISEQLILYDADAPFAFVPVVPLFVAKASEKERLNNGNIAFDLNYRFQGLGRVYSEFLIDDIQSPTSLFGDAWGNKWGWMAGAQIVKELGRLESGIVAEYSRLEPWVYSHYIPHTAQTANLDYPLGNPWGPNSQVMALSASMAREGAWHATLRAEIAWKGGDPGSEIEDVHSDGVHGGKKAFLSGAGDPDFRILPSLWCRRGRMIFRIQADLLSGLAMSAGGQWRY